MAYTATALLSAVTTTGAGTAINLGGPFDEFTIQLINNSLGTLSAGATTSGQVQVTCTSTTGVVPGMILTGTGIPANTTVVTVTNSTTLQLSQQATATGSSLTFTYYGGISAIACNLEGSTTGNTTGAPGEWFTLATITKVADGSRSFSWQKPVNFIRANLTTLTGSGTPSITCNVVYGSTLGSAVASTNAEDAVSSSTTAALTVVNVKATPGNVYGISVYNANAVAIWIQFYNTAGTPTLGTSAIWSIAVAPTSAVNIPPGSIALGNFSTGIGIGASTSPLSTGTPGTAPGVTIFYQ